MFSPTKHYPACPCHLWKRRGGITKSLFFLAVVTLCGLALPPSNASAATFPEGMWYTEGSENGQFAQFVIVTNSDGTFTKDIRDNTDCKAPKSWRETGEWKMEGMRYIEVTETVMGERVLASDAEYNDLFQITPVDDTHATMFDVKTKVSWGMEYVGPDFQFPQPLHCSPGA